MTPPEARVRELTEARFKEYADEVLRSKSWADRDVSKQAAREKRRRDFVASIEIDLKKFDAGLGKDDHAQEAELKSFLAEFRAKSASRRSLRAADARVSEAKCWPSPATWCCQRSPHPSSRPTRHYCIIADTQLAARASLQHRSASRKGPIFAQNPLSEAVSFILRMTPLGGAANA